MPTTTRLSIGRSHTAPSNILSFFLAVFISSTLAHIIMETDESHLGMDPEEADYERDEERGEGVSSYDNALRENIATKGRNSYYYAHGQQREGPSWDGKEQPRLLSTDALPSQSSLGSRTKTLPVPSYMWADGKSKLKVYVETDFLGLGASVLTETDVHLNSTEDSFSLTVTNNNAVYALAITKLQKKIKGAALVIKSDKIVVSLEKIESESWYKLHE
jgi:hypothetical protein